jgi:hypothetical protein
LTREKLSYFRNASLTMLTHPFTGVERVRGRLDRRGDRRAFAASGLSIAELYPLDADWLMHLHEAMGWKWPCEAAVEAARIRQEVSDLFSSLRLPETYDDWCDGGEAFTSAAYCLTVHLRPEIVVETGIARGVTSRLILEALARSGSGRLYSVDLPALNSSYHPQIAIAVPESMRAGWTIRLGTSRRELPPLLRALDGVDLFVHDSLHTGRNTTFELEQAATALRPGGAVLVDDVYQSLAFRSFVDANPLHWSCVGANPDGSYRFGIALTQ